jgi:hypothetical protein
MAEILADECMVEVRAMLERRYFEEFKQADSSEKRVTAWAKAHLLDDFWNQLHVVKDRGEHEAHELARALKPKKEQ